MSVFTYLNLKESYFFPSSQCLYSLYSESFYTNTERSENPRNKVPHEPRDNQVKKQLIVKHRRSHIREAGGC